MQIIIRLFFTSIFLMSSGCEEMNPEPIDYIPTPGEIVIVDKNVEESDAVKHTIEIFPMEIYFGDNIYMIEYDENISDELARKYKDIREFDPFTAAGAITSDATPHRYEWVPEYRSRMSQDRIYNNRDLLPHEKRPQYKYCLEFPPLEDWDHPFWKELRDKMPPEGLTCQLRIRDGYIDHWAFQKMEVIQDIVIKPRPAAETALLQKWYENTPEKLFPKVDGNRKIPHGRELKSSGKSDIKIGSKRYDPWMFIRLGNRKPSDPNNPVTISEWRELEAGLVPSTMRDEIRFTRLQLEYYDAKKGTKTDEAKTELVDWLKTLPGVQRNIMISSLVSNMYHFKKTALEEKNRELLRSLHGLMDVGSQEHAYYSSDRILPEPEGVEIIRPFIEVVTPTAEDLAHGSKELPDGFRIWDATSAVGPYQMVGKFIELKEDEDRLNLKNRDGLTFNLVFSALSDEDKQHARELSRTGVEQELE